MIGQYVVKDPVLQEAIVKYFPGVDLSKPFKSFDEIKILIKGINEKRKKEGVQNRLAMISAKKIEPGCQVVDEDNKIFTVSKIRKDGYVILKGLKGAFNATYLWRI